MLKTSKDTLDPEDWQAFRRDSHQMLDDMLDHLENLHSKPVWQPSPADLLSDEYAQLSAESAELKNVHQWFMTQILPYSVGNIHPGFMGWVHGAGTVVGMVAELLAAGLNANVGGRNQAPVALEQQLTQWLKDLFSFPDSAGGLMVSGTSMANLIGVLIAKTWFLGETSRQLGLAQSHRRLVAYTASSAHVSLTQALEITGLGSDALRLMPVNSQFQLDVNALKAAIMADKANGFEPFLIAATAGSVDVGAIDPLPELAELAHEQGLWLHVDGAYAALAMLSPELAPLLQGIQAADSLAFDFHKWGQVPYDAGFILVRDQQQQLATFASPAAYLMRAERGLAAGSPWPCDLGPELSRGFKALKTWFTLKVYGTQKLGHVMWHTCQLAHYLKEKILMCDKLELLAPVTLNIVCFRYRAEQADAVNAKIVIALQESGIAAPSTTKINTLLAIRVAIFNHRTTEVHIDAMLDACLRFGKQFSVYTHTEAFMTTELPDYANRPFIGFAPLMASALAGFDLAPLGSLLLERVKTEPKPETLIDIANILFLRGFPELALSIQKEALSQQQLYQPPITEQPIQLRLLVLMSAGDLMANTPLEFLIQHSDIGLTQVYVTETSPLPDTVPEHDVLFVAVAQSDANMAILNSLTNKLANWPKPVLNKPEAISLLARNHVADRLQDAPGLVAPETLRVSKHDLITVHEILTDDDYPLIIRPVDSHAGQGLAKIDSYSALIDYLTTENAEEFYLASFYDYKSADGLYRKYRIVLIAGKPYLCHQAISEQWMIHYLNAGMADNAEKRAEEAASMAAFDQTFAIKHASALQHIADCFGLDYLGIDCAETPDGQLLVFEVDSCMIIHNLDPIEAFPYKQDAMQKVFAAFRSLLINASQQH